MNEPPNTGELLKKLKLNPLTIAAISATVAVIMGLVDTLVHPTFRVSVGESFVLPLWIPFALYAGLQYFIYSQTERGLDMSDAEIARWGKKLEEATPVIVEGLQTQRTIREIADELESSEGIPVDITLRYVVHVGRALDLEV